MRHDLYRMFYPLEKAQQLDCRQELGGDPVRNVKNDPTL